jgi:isocitrate dehydrogenase
MVVFRENTEDLYTGIEWPADSPEANRIIEWLRREFGVEIRPGSAIGIKPMSPFGSKRLVRKAIRYALDHKRRNVTLVHKGNIMKYTEGGFREWGYQVAKEEFGDQTVTWEEVQTRYGGRIPEGKLLIQDFMADITFQHIVIRPQDIDVIATGNLNGDYLSDAIAALVGGIGMAPGANIGDFHAVFEATHGTAPKYAGQDKVNPTSLLLSAVMMLEYIGWQEAADLVIRGLEATFRKKVVTYDLARLMEGAREVRTSEFATEVINNL